MFRTYEELYHFLQPPKMNFDAFDISGKLLGYAREVLGTFWEMCVGTFFGHVWEVWGAAGNDTILHMF